MTVRQRAPFDYPAFKHALRQQATARGIDPVEGATSYQAALVQAEQRIAAILASPDYGWWATRDIFSSRDEHTLSPRLVKPPDALVPLDTAALIDILRLLFSELVHETPVRVVQEHQLAWAELRAQRQVELRQKLGLDAPVKPAKRRRARWSLSGGGVPVRAVV